jgi:predicted RNA-binding Zn-ribbon protein involved in translation (DUF1610 family)
MCEIGSFCPNCGNPSLDEDETSCITLEGIAYREYHCRVCDAHIQVRARLTKMPAPRRGQIDVALPEESGR